MQGLVKAVGVSNYGPKQLRRIHKYLERKGVPLSSVQVIPVLIHKLFDGHIYILSSQGTFFVYIFLIGSSNWMAVQVQFSLLSKGADQMEVKAVCDELGIQLIAYSPLGLGMLTDKYSPTNVPSGPR